MSQKSENRIIQISSTVAFFIGLIYAFFLLGDNLFNNKTINTTEVQIVAVLLAAGLLGNVLNYVLRKIVKDQIVQYLPEEKLKEIIDEQVADLYIAKAEEEKKNEIDESIDTSALNTVIVPVERTLDIIKKEGFYRCPSYYKFKQGLEYIAFYKNKRIVGYGKLVSPPHYNDDSNGMKEFKIEEFISKEIPHNKKGAFVQNKMYCNIDKLKNARTTDEIRDLNYL